MDLYEDIPPSCPTSLLTQIAVNSIGRRVRRKPDRISVTKVHVDIPQGEVSVHGTVLGEYMSWEIIYECPHS